MSITIQDFQISQNSMEISASKMTVNGLCLDSLRIKFSKVSNKKSVMGRKACMFMKTSFYPRIASVEVPKPQLNH